LVCATEPDEILAALDDGRPDCLVVGSRISKSRVFALLDELRERDDLRELPVILRLDRTVTARDRARLRRYPPALQPQVVESDEALAAETAVVLHPADPATESSPDLAPLGDVSDADLHGRRILLVDDDVRNLFALASLLEDRGAEVLFSETGHEALEILQGDTKIDLVLMDIMMPQMDGYETIGAVRAIPALRDLPIIAVTAKAMQGDREKSIAAGASDYITKPVDPEKLTSLIRGWLRAWR
jgi:CheY-like chemotaxis protein